jgi:hypothetical protein
MSDMPRSRRVHVLPLLLVAMTVACTGSSQEERAMQMDQEWRELSARPNIEQALAQHVALLTRLRTALTDATGLASWEQSDGPHRAGCGEALITYHVSEEGSSGSWRTGAIPEAAWPRAKAAFIAEAAKDGFTTVETVVDEPGNHTVAIQGPHGAILNLGVGRRTVMYIRSGCHLVPGAVKPTPTGG